jgi:predicted 3-demethylubiquinone-9 3-methyltransferase (glyoxalase superfamily)
VLPSDTVGRRGRAALEKKNTIRCRSRRRGSDRSVKAPQNDARRRIPMPKITTFLTYDNQAEDAAKFYTSVFKNSKIVSTSRYGEGGPGPKGSLMTATISLDGQEIMLLNGGPSFVFSPAISLFVSCETQAEVDEYWSKLSAGGTEVQCGWVTDKFGVSWQIIPTILGQLMGDKDPKRAARAMQAMMKMVKIDIEGLRKAAEG